MTNSFKIDITVDGSERSIPAWYVPYVIKTMDDLGFEPSPKFTARNRIIAKFITEKYPEVKRALTDYPRFYKKGHKTNYLIHYGSKLSDSSGCALVPLIVHRDYVAMYKDLLYQFSPKNLWTINAFVTNASILKEIGII